MVERLFQGLEKGVVGVVSCSVALLHLLVSELALAKLLCSQG